MNFTQTQIKKLLKEKPVQVRKLVKEGEELLDFPTVKGNNPVTWEYYIHKPTVVTGYNHLNFKRKKWQVGKDYSVQEDVLESGLWYCPICKKIRTITAFYNNTILLSSNIDPFHPLCYCEKKLKKLEPLRFKITGIRKEALWDITRKDSKMEGFDSICDFLKYFLYKNRIKKWNRFRESALYTMYVELKEGVIPRPKEWNPEVWVLEGVKK